MVALEKSYLYDYQVDTAIIKVPFKITNDLFIEQYEYYWHKGINDPLNQTESFNYDGPLASSIKSKLFRENDFMEYMKERLPEGFKINSEKKTLSDLKPLGFIRESSTCKAINTRIDAMRTLFNSLEDLKGEEFKTAARNLSIKSLDDDVIKECLPEFESEKEAESEYYRMRDIVYKTNSALNRMNAYIIE